MTSADILFFIGTLAIILLTGFLCMALFYAICILRRIHCAMRSAEERMESFLDSWREFVGRVSGLRNSLDIITSGLKAALSLYQRRAAQDMDIPDKEDDLESKKEKKQLRKRKGRKNFFSSEEDG